eukprot:CAMPEP_0118684916 /NCGR_PEP_ID=MMETSP0800-20121206/6923_1 /TAXON_ID=210618 ORGANISM="Striatella unipunctata, Strain CCMP2910" /NCGR_SAMPLE_ID=MMETSP0800 /ASSEMBLY_ACC=CAM_ASM_000638 /LENGTH=285 /DNA_ID=CAMNT_0006581703 /DNA_START=455 /DNA_END=1312 /DNA_ORIENTATION=-
MSENNNSANTITVWHDLIAGGIAGSMSVFVGHPFDTIKVRMQSSASASTSHLWSSGLFRGLGPPLSSAAILNAIIFSSFGESSRLWDLYLPQREELHPYKSFVCGCVAGFIQCNVLCPMEHVKCRLQLQQEYKNSWDATNGIARRHGVAALFRGWTATVWREVPAFGLYFAMYDWVKDFVSNKMKNTTSISTTTWVPSAVSGGVTGAATWALIYPFDVIKTRIQTMDIDTHLSSRRILSVGRSLVSQHGWSILVRGLGVCLMRAFPVNAIIFPVYEYSLGILAKL